jgi:haloacid dehalogenase-like hydrolase
MPDHWAIAEVGTVPTAVFGPRRPASTSRHTLCVGFTWGKPAVGSSDLFTLTQNQEVPSMRHGYLIDMDGVLYRGHAMIPGADAFIHELREREIPFRFLTNNSQRTRRDIVAKLQRMGIDVLEEHV